jgi:hypothetical protein
VQDGFRIISEEAVASSRNSEIEEDSPTQLMVEIRKKTSNSNEES